MRVAIEQGFPQQQAQGMFLCGWTRADQGHREEGITQMREGLAAWEATGARLLRPYYLCLLAEAHATASMASEGLRLAAEALSVVQSSGERNFEAELNRVHGELLLAHPAADASSAELSFPRSRHCPQAAGQSARGPRRHEPGPIVAGARQTGERPSTAGRGLRMVQRGLRHGGPDTGQGDPDLLGREVARPSSGDRHPLWRGSWAASV